MYVVHLPTLNFRKFQQRLEKAQAVAIAIAGGGYGDAGGQSPGRESIGRFALDNPRDGRIGKTGIPGKFNLT